MKRTLVVMGIALFSVCLISASRAMRFEDMFTAGRVSSPVISPDGRWIAFCVRFADVSANKFSNDIYLTDIKGSTIQKLPLGSGNHSQPVFQANGMLTFISTRDGEGQVYAIDIKNPKEVKPIIQIPGGIDTFFWTPDQKKIIFSKEVFPAAPSLAESVKWENEKEKSPVKAKLLTTIPFRIFNQWKDGKRSHVFLLETETKSIVDLTPGEYDTPPVDLGGAQDYTISPDGKWFAYVKNADPLIAISTNNDVYLRDLATGKEENLTKANLGNDAGPVFSPKKLHLAYLSMKRVQFEADKKDIILYNLEKKTYTNLTEAFTNTIQDFIFSTDEKSIYFIAPQGVYQPIFKLEVKTRKIEEIVPRVFASSLRLTPDGKELVFLSQTVQKPDELFKLNLAKRIKTQLSKINDSRFQDIATNPAETFTFKGAKDEPVECIMVKPPFFDPQKKYPLVFLVHGGPQGLWGDDFHFRWNMSMFAAPGYVVAGINFHGSTGYGQKFTDSISRDWGGAPFIDMVRGQQHLVEQFPFIDKERIVAAGASYGGFLINWMAGHINEFKYPFRCLISHASIFEAVSMYYSTEELWFDEWEHGGVPWKSDLYQKWNPANFVTGFKVPMLVVHGERDFRVPVTQGFMLFTALQRLGVESKMLYFPDEGHFVAKPQNALLWWQTVYDWIAAHIR